MIKLIHGENQKESRSALLALIAELKLETIFLDAKKITLPDVYLACESKSLFQSQKLIVFENFFQGKKTKDKQNIVDFLLTDHHFNELIFWENKKIENLKSFKFSKQISILSFNYDGNIFNFLDSLGKLTLKEIYKSFHRLLKANDAEIIYTMLVRQFRILLLVKGTTANNSGLVDWMYYKFKKQSDNFELNYLISIYRKLLNLDFQLKTGKTPYKKEQLLDIFFTTF